MIHLGQVESFLPKICPGCLSTMVIVCLLSKSKALAFCCVDWNDAKYISLSKHWCCPSLWAPDYLQLQQLHGGGCQINEETLIQVLWLFKTYPAPSGERWKALTQQLLTDADASDEDGGLNPNLKVGRFGFASPLLSIFQCPRALVFIFFGSTEALDVMFAFTVKGSFHHTYLWWWLCCSSHLCWAWHPNWRTLP